MSKSKWVRLKIQRPRISKGNYNYYRWILWGSDWFSSVTMLVKEHVLTKEQVSYSGKGNLETGVTWQVHLASHWKPITYAQFRKDLKNARNH